jgi:Tol biopolymer transport system component
VKVWPLTTKQNTTRYLYGVYFHNFIVSRYGEEKIQELIENYSDNIIPLSINSNSNETFGKTMDVLWLEFTDYLNKEFLPEIQNITQKGITNSKQLTHSGYSNTSPKTTPEGDVYFIQDDKQSEPRLMVLKNGADKPQIIAETHGRYFDLHPQAGIVVAELDAYKNTNILSDLHHIDLQTGKKTKITLGGRYLYASWSPDGNNIIAVHNELGEQALHLLDRHGKFLQNLWQGNNKSVLGQPDWAPHSNKLVVSVWRPETQWNLEIFDTDRRQWTQLTHSKNIETTPHFTANDQEIIFSADYSGVFNLYRLNLTDGNTTKISNVIGGAFSPAPVSDVTNQDNQGIYYTAIGKNGFDLFYLENPLELTSSKNYEGENSTPRKEAETPTNLYSDNPTEDYDAISRITPTGWYPYFLKTDHTNEIGFNTWGSDPIRRHSYTLMAAYDTDNKWYVGRLDYLYDRWDPTLKFSLSRNTVTYLDINGDVERFRNQDTFTIEGVWPFLSYEQQWLFHAGIIHQTETDKEIFSIFGPLDATSDDITGVAVSYSSTHTYPISISPNNGRQVKLIAEDYELLESFHTGHVFTLDWKEFFGLPGQNVISARGVFGSGTDSPEPFRLGGTRETSVSAQPNSAAFAATERIFGQRRYPLHGYPTSRGDLRGTHMLLAELEWLSPIARVERGLMAPPIGLHQVYGKLFLNWGETWNESFKIPSLRRGAGAELSMNMILGYWLPLDVNFGYAKGFDKGGEEQTYIEILASF